MFTNHPRRVHEALIEMKEAVNRPRDQDDVQHLRWIEEDKGNE